MYSRQLSTCISLGCPSNARAGFGSMLTHGPSHSTLTWSFSTPVALLSGVPVCRGAAQVTAILAAGHQLPFEVKMQNLDLPELQVLKRLHMCPSCASLPTQSAVHWLSVDRHCWVRLPVLSSRQQSSWHRCILCQ